LITTLLSFIIAGAFLEALTLPYDPENTNSIDSGPHWRYLPSALIFISVGIIGFIGAAYLMDGKKLLWGKIASFLFLLAIFANTSEYVLVSVLYGTLGMTHFIVIISLLILILLFIIGKNRTRFSIMVQPNDALIPPP
jgi:hypothetical protein